MSAAPDNFEKFGAKFAELVRIMARLRAPGGCPWDRKQTFDTIKSYLLEETYEVLDAIDKQNWPDLADELGDLLLQPVFLAEMAAEANLFTIGDALDAINQKLVRRHPHIFGNTSAETAEDVKRKWDEIKREERQVKGAPEDVSILDAIPRNLPALVEADKLGKKAAGIGFDWPNVDGALEKLQEEAAELAEAQGRASSGHIEHELGDILFCVVNVARFLRLDPEQALRKANARFRRRFAHVEQGTGGEPVSLDRMEELWQEAKTLESEAE
ncbi:MAG TPA: nucleoside triphosphate pyrophosphohydrolase [Bryobacteraceae bacterium]|nr:nucleoside triphosphate pyrophosphohydrolase [Bryobacteraceae bacterium]